jgi:hypothetical protein
MRPSTGLMVFCSTLASSRSNRPPTDGRRARRYPSIGLRQPLAGQLAPDRAPLIIRAPSHCCSAPGPTTVSTQCEWRRCCKATLRGLEALASLSVPYADAVRARARTRATRWVRRPQVYREGGSSIRLASRWRGRSLLSTSFSSIRYPHDFILTIGSRQSRAFPRGNRVGQSRMPRDGSTRRVRSDAHRSVKQAGFVSTGCRALEADFIRWRTGRGRHVRLRSSTKYG